MSREVGEPLRKVSDSPRTHRRTGSWSPWGPPGGLEVRVLQAKIPRPESPHPRSGALRHKLLPVPPPPGSGTSPVTPAGSPFPEEKGAASPQPGLGTTSPPARCQSLHPLPGPGEAGARKPRSGPHVLSANPPSRSNQTGSCWQTGLRGSAQGAFPARDAGHQPERPPCRPYCRAGGLLCRPFKPHGGSGQPGLFPRPLVTLCSPSMGMEETRAARLFQATSPRAPLAD